MEPGRKLDTLIAERVMGWVIWDPIACRGEPPHQAELAAIPRYSLDMVDAWLVWEHLCWLKGERWPKTEISLSFHSDYGIDRLRGWCVNLGATKVVKFADTAPHAICLAALELVNH